MIKPFSESNLFELGNDSDEFYATGSAASVGEKPGTFSRPLSEKERVSVSFPVKIQTKMLSNSSSIYYFNSVDGRWDPPPGASSDFSGPFSNVSLKTGVAAGSNFIEDHLCFDHKGNTLVSGSLSIFRNNNGNITQKIEEEETFWFSLTPSDINKDKISSYLAKDYPKSLQRNASYFATGSQTFSLNTTNPFLVEKVVIELPVCFGSSWFRDKTTECYTTSSLGDYTLDGNSGMGFGINVQAKIFDQGGPGLTVALFSQKNYGATKILDLIGTAYVTHEDDAKRELAIRPVGTSNIGNGIDWMQLEIIGNNREDVDAIVKGNNQRFTGSVNVKMQSRISNGAKVSVGEIVFPGGIPNFSFESYMNNLMSSQYYLPFAVGFLGFNAFGRGMTGFSPSGGSIFGGEYVTASELTYSSKGLVKNPFYISSSADRATNLASLVARYTPFSPEAIRLFGSVFAGDKKDSPYLMYPGEKLILSVSKTRPTTNRFKVNIDSTADPDGELFGRGTLLSSSYYHDLGDPLGHDVQFNTGSVNITFYGSYVREGNSYKP